MSVKYSTVRKFLSQRTVMPYSEHAAFAREVARQGAVEAMTELHGIGAAEAGSEFDVRASATLGELAERAVGLERRIASAEDLGKSGLADLGKKWA